MKWRTQEGLLIDDREVEVSSRNGSGVMEAHLEQGWVEVRPANPEQQSAAPMPGHRVRHMADILADPPPEAPTLLEPAFIVSGGLTVISAPTKVGKTNLWLHIAWALTEGKPLFGRFAVTRPARVLMLQLELGEATMHKRLELLAPQLGWSADAQQRFHVWVGRALLLDRNQGPAEVVKVIRSLPEPPDVVILDSYNAAIAGDPDRSAEARRALHALRTVQEQTGVAWGVTAEVRKAPSMGRLRVDLDDLKGSNELAYDADAVVMLKPSSEDRRRLHLRFAAMRHATEDPPEDLMLVRKGLSFELTQGASDDAHEEIEKALQEHFAEGGGTTWRDCVSAVRDRGIRARNNVIGDVRKTLMKSEPTLFDDEATE